jgi:transposase
LLLPDNIIEQTFLAFVIGGMCAGALISLSYTRAFAAIGGVPNLLAPDNTEVAVIKACLYEPQVNRTYAEMATHYDTAILPARPRRPRDKAKAEVAVLIIERWLLGRLRHRRFLQSGRTQCGDR